MQRRKRRTVAAALAALLLSAPAGAKTVNATVSAKVVKPLAIEHIQDFDLGTVLIPTGSWPGATLRLSRGGVLDCPPPLVCSGATRVAIYNITGSNQTTVRISAPSVTMVNQSDPTKTLTLTIDSPATLVLPNSGNPGVNVQMGGSLPLSSATAGGVYEGTFNVTVDY